MKNIYEVRPHPFGGFAVDRVPPSTGVRGHVSFSFRTRREATNRMYALIKEDNTGRKISRAKENA